MHRRTALLYGGALSVLLVAPALAQDASPAPVGKSTIETVIVTAEKREQKSQDVPVPMSAIGGDLLDTLGIRDVASLGNRVPNLYFGPSPTGGENFITMRGLTSANTTNGGDTPVSFSIDGVFFGRSTGVDPEMFDIQTIEVLRGPQGTLYGRNSVGGSINIITNKPTDEFAGHVDALIGDYNARILRGWMNVPLYSCGECKILARIVGVSANHDGYQKNISTAPFATHNSDGQDYDMLRGHLLFQFNADVDLLLSASQDHSYSPVATKTQWWQYYNTANLTGTQFPNAGGRFNGQTYYSDPRLVEKDYPETFQGVHQSISATFNWNMGWAKLTSITGRQKIYMAQQNDSDSSNLDIGHSDRWQVSTSQYSQELRLASNNDADPLKWIIGGFYYHEHTEMTFPFTDHGVTGFGGVGGMPGPNLVNSFQPFDLQSQDSYKTTSWAAFGQVDYDFAKTSAEVPLTATLGLRYTHDHKYGWGSLNYWLTDLSQLFCSFVPGTAKFWDLGHVGSPACRVATSRTLLDQRFGQITGKAGLSYKVTPDVMIYASASRGYLSGGFLGVRYKPETAWNYEAGFKSEFLDNTFQLNVNGYYMDVKDIQVFVQDAALGSRVDNADGAKIYGVEGELIAIPVENLRVNLTGMIQSAKYKDYLTDDGRYSGTLIVNNKGHRLLQTPKWTVNAGLEYGFVTDVGTITPRVDVFWSSNVFLTTFNTPLAEQPSYALVDLALGWTDVKQRYTIDLFARNVFDKDVIASDGTQSGSFGFGLQADNFTYRAPRTIGVRFGANF